MLDWISFKRHDWNMSCILNKDIELKIVLRSLKNPAERELQSDPVGLFASLFKQAKRGA